jgi:ribosomal protein S18 acetylase RimI-like enzyme
MKIDKRDPIKDAETSHSYEELIGLADLNFWESYRDMTRRTRRGAIREENGLLLHAGGHASPVVVNGVKRTYANLPPEDILTEAERFFRERGHGYTINIRLHADQDMEEAVANAGYTLALELPVMVIDHRLAEKDEKDSLSVAQIDSEKQIADFILVTSEAFEVYPGLQGLAQSVFNEPRSLLAPHIAAFVAYFDGTPVAAAMAMVSYGVAFIGWVGTRPAFRGQGFGEAVTRAATNAGFDLGARMASLQASPLGEPLYRRMGYFEITRYREYMPPFPG